MLVAIAEVDAVAASGTVNLALDCNLKFVQACAPGVDCGRLNSECQVQPAVSVVGRDGAAQSIRRVGRLALPEKEEHLALGHTKSNQAAFFLINFVEAKQGFVKTTRSGQVRYVKGRFGKSCHIGHWRRELLLAMDLVLGAVSDLMFSVRIGDAAKRAGKRVVFVGTFERLMAQLENNPTLVIVDLACAGAEPVGAIREARQRGIHVIAFGAHVDVEALKAARDAGANQVMPRLRFVEQLKQLIKE